MTRLAEINSHIASMTELLEIVGAMRSLAGIRVQEAQRSLQGVRRYSESVADAIGAALLLMPQPSQEEMSSRGRRAVIICTAEHGFVGAFNERLLEAAQKRLEPTDLLFVLGSRGAALALERGLNPQWTHAMAGRVTGVPDLIDRLTHELYTRIAQGQIGRIELISSRYRQGGAPAIEHRTLLPLDTATFALSQPRQAPLHNLPPRRLLERLMTEYVLALFTEAVVESIGSENAARFAAMQAAHDNVEEKLGTLRQAGRRARQGEITEELIDLITGTEALAL
ncbi:MAG: F0F1 ATP synthase subunit gamma [Proteobacteria bacterium]|nr:F0F1 ATP synthase subunit gamma [Pseudomonadota bacterium]